MGEWGQGGREDEGRAESGGRGRGVALMMDVLHRQSYELYTFTCMMSKYILFILMMSV